MGYTTRCSIEVYASAVALLGCGSTTTTLYLIRGLAHEAQHSASEDERERHGGRRPRAGRGVRYARAVVDGVDGVLVECQC